MATRRAQQVQKETKELTTLFKAVFESMTDGIIIYDLEEKIVQINTATQKLLELRPEAIIGKPYYQLMDHCEMRDEQRQLLQSEQLVTCRMLQSKKVTHPRDMQIRLPSGHEIQASVTDTPIYDQQGRMIGGFTIFRDVTEQRQKEHRVLQAFTSLLTLVEALAAIPEQEEKTSIEEGCLTSRIIAAGKSLAEIISQVLNCRYVVVFALEPPDDRHLLLGISGLTPEQEERLRAETNRAPLVDYIHATDIARLRANHVVTIDLKHQPYPTPRSDFGARYRLIAPMVLHGQLVGLFVIAKTSAEHADIASAYTQEEIALAKGVAKLTALVIERVRLLQEWAEARARELALQEANRHYDSFLSIASHELRTPLTTVKGNMQLAQRRLETLKRQLEQSPTLIEQLERVQKPLEYAVQRANAQERMISELLDASRMQVGRLKIMIHPCNLIEIVQNVVEDVQQTAADRALLLELPEEKTIPILADADRIGQVVHNYLSNALKYSPADRQVEVSVKQEGPLAYVFVKDQGPGLSPEAQTQIWERFYRAPGIEVQYGSDSGLGLGLYLSRTIIELHHGQVGVHSVRGKGSTFWFAIPVTKPPTLS